MIQRVIILGFLKKNPASGYDLKKFINQDLGIFSASQNQSIYYPLTQMAREGLIKRTRQISKSKGITKYVYSITDKGQKEFNKLCRQTLISQQRPFIETDIALYFLPYLNFQEVIPLLRLRLMFLERVKHWLKDKSSELISSPRNLKLLLDHHYRLADAEKDFLKEIITVIKKERK